MGFEDIRKSPSPEERLATDLKFRQDQLATMLGIDPELLRGLSFCRQCGGAEYDWDDLSCMDIGDQFSDEPNFDFGEYRSQIAEKTCQACDGSSFEGGSFELSVEEWIALGQEGLVSI